MNLTLHDNDGLVLINSHELYSELELNRKYYYRWIQTILKNPTLVAGKDYFTFEPQSKRRGRIENQYLFSVVLTKSLCITTGTMVSKKIKVHLEKLEKVKRRRTLHF